MKVKLVLVAILGLLTVVVSASQYAFTQATPAPTSRRQTETLLIRIETKLDVLKDEAQRVAERNSNQASANQLGADLSTLTESVTKLHSTLGNRSPIADDLRQALTKATMIEQHVVRNRVTPSIQSQWRSLKTDFTSLATANGLNWDWNQQTSPFDDPVETSPTSTGSHTVPASQVRTLLSRLELKTNNYKSQMDTALKTDTTANRPGAAISDYIGRLETAQRQLLQRFERSESTSADTTEVLTRATYIDQFMTTNRLSPQTQAQWRNLKADLNTLATYYNVSWNWNQKLPSDTGTSDTGLDMRNFDPRLTGTYRLNTSLSEDTKAAIDKALGATPAGARENYRRRLEQRLTSPGVIAIEKKGTSISLASSIQSQVTFQADGVARSETNERGRTVTTTATADQDGLIINYQGERSSDFYLTFLPVADRRMKMTRRVYLDNSSNTITVSSVYDKIDRMPRWDVATNTVSNNTAPVSSTVNDSFVVPTGSKLSAELRSAITDASAQQFTMEVTTIGRYKGAVIGGRIVPEDAASKVSGRSRVLLVFETIRLPHGQTYRFAGNIDSVEAVFGDAVTVTNQPAKTGTQPKKPGGILGAVIGAISGVPPDPATNSTSTAGSVLSQNRDKIEIDSGSTVEITATATGTVTNPK
ncbi:MAG TPA: hypothetical protein VJV05_05540 [Pyrinomonadaceae bacterium]|nr:hypothetical protein [Pyrinomonadaceae bacterium]